MEGLANRNSSESCVYMGNCVGEALTGGDAGQVLSCERTNLECRRRGPKRKANSDQTIIGCSVICELHLDSTQSETLCMYPGILYGSWEIPLLVAGGTATRVVNSKEVRQ